MALKFEKIYIVETPAKALKSTDIERVVKTLTGHSDQELESVIFRLTWDGEYLDFNFNRNGFVPREGSVRVLNNTSFCRQFDIKDLYRLIRDSTSFLIFEGVKPLNLSHLDVFTKVRTHIVKDYERMLKDLEKLNIIRTAKSINTLSTSGKRFLFKRTEDQIKYGSDYFEVDSLGGKLMEHITQAIEQRWIQLKGGKQEH